MAPGALALALAVHLSTTVGVVPPELVGFDDKDIPTARTAVGRAVTATGHKAALGPEVDEACAADGTCVAARLEGADFEHLVRVTALRVGDDVEVEDTLWDRGGAVVATGKRIVTVEGFLQSPLSSEVSAVLLAAAEASADPATGGSGGTATKTPDPAPDPALKPRFIVAGAGGVLATIGLIGFAVEAATLEDPASRGADKDRARTTGWLFLGMTAVGVGAAAGGLVWALMPEDGAAVPATPPPATPANQTPAPIADDALLDS